MEWQQFIGVVAVPAVLWLANAVRAARTETATVVKDLADYKLQVAEKYASVNYLKDVEKRLLDGLERIEKKIDRQGVPHHV
jgi:hypothetical protein